MNAAGLFKHFVLGVQSTSVGIEKVAQLILGCPGETLESWKTSLADMFEIGITRLSILRLQVLPNSPAYTAEYRSKWKMKTTFRRCKDHFGRSGENIGEYIHSRIM